MSDSERSGLPIHDSTRCSQADGPPEIDPLRSQDGSPRYASCTDCHGRGVWIKETREWSALMRCTVCFGTGRIAKKLAQ
jgi:DnaJ-class molecular chaperone